MAPDCVQPSIWFELVKGIPTALVALLVGGIAAFVAWRQYKTAEAGLKLDLFDKRYEIFEKTWGYLSEVVQNGPGKTPLTPFTNIIPQAGFLFGPDVEGYLNEIVRKRSQLWAIDARTRASGDVIRPEDIDPDTELLKWFSDEASTGAKKMFGPWLDFGNWK